ncbi:cytochrome P450 [Streptomyces sp. DT2A-34]|uniref:cytochrome P450 n=1 Tax=Streptomyces sp. DT2A-34 TaxID=3051182 RepID=UPI00265BA1B9|nr:cytochrome P450 [Streptomyces sp. DT2A-34]MDO0915330.1 cytochrome P450 [Streptomyces sp. DT2A-34]
MTREDTPVPPPGCPAHGSGERIPMYTPEFAADPQAYYAYMRHHGPMAPVELAPGVEATLVTDYATALDLLHNPGDFRKDARRWRAFNEGMISPDSPVLPLLVHRPNCMFSDGAEHLRLRQAVTESFAQVDSRRLSESVDRIARYLLAQFSARGSADLLNDYAKQLPLFVFNELFGCPAEIGDRVMFGISGIFDGVNAEKANEVLFQAVSELVALKRTRPDDDVTSWLMRHPARLNDQEMAHHLVLLLGAGAEPLRNLIGNTLHLLLTNDRYAQSGLLEEALDDTLWRNPPMSNYAPHYPARDMEFAGQKLSAGDLVLVGFQAANAASARSTTGQGSNRAHLAWSAGPHACPSKEPARLITLAAIEHLFNELPDIELAVPEESLTWRPGPFNRALAGLPARFTPVAPRHAVQPQPSQPSQSTAAAEAARAKGRGGLWSSFLNWMRA